MDNKIEIEVSFRRLGNYAYHDPDPNMHISKNLPDKVRIRALLKVLIKNEHPHNFSLKPGYELEK